MGEFFEQCFISYISFVSEQEYMKNNKIVLNSFPSSAKYQILIKIVAIFLKFVNLNLKITNIMCFSIDRVYFYL